MKKSVKIFFRLPLLGALKFIRSLADVILPRLFSPNLEETSAARGNRLRDHDLRAHRIAIPGDS